MITRSGAFLVAVALLLAIHEGAHILVARAFDEYDHVRRFSLFVEVCYRTPPEYRSGVQWALISGTSNVATLLIGYLLLAHRTSLAGYRGVFVRGTFFYLTLVALIMDPLNLSIGPFIYRGDAIGIARGLGVHRGLVQAVFFVVLLVNRELIAHTLFPTYGVAAHHPLFRPLVRWGSTAQRG